MHAQTTLKAGDQLSRRVIKSTQILSSHFLQENFFTWRKLSMKAVCFMNLKKFFRRTLAALLIVAIFLTATIVGATVKMYSVFAEDYQREVESMDISK